MFIRRGAALIRRELVFAFYLEGLLILFRSYHSIQELFVRRLSIADFLGRVAHIVFTHSAHDLAHLLIAHSETSTNLLNAKDIA